MPEKLYSQRLGSIADAQFQAALDRFNAGRFLHAEPIPFGVWGQNVFVTSSEGEFVLRGDPHFSWQFPTEQFYTQQIHERTRVPVPWPYLIDENTDIFGWSYVLMPRMPGLQLADLQVRQSLPFADRLGIARALGENLAAMQQAKHPFSGRYDATTQTVEPFGLASELAWPFDVASDARLAAIPPTPISYSQRVTVCIRHYLARSQELNPPSTSASDIAWAEDIIMEAGQALNDDFTPCLVMEDYKEGNLVVFQDEGRWRVSGVFDLMEAHFGDGEADLARQIGEYLNEDPQLAHEFLHAYLNNSQSRPGFEQRFPVYMLLDRALLWEFFQRTGLHWWDEEWTFRDWAEQYTSLDTGQ